MQTDLRRGFYLVPTSWEYGLHYCLGPAGSISTCTRDDGKPMYDKQPINRAAESAKLTALHSEQARLKKAIAACALQYPE